MPLRRPIKLIMTGMQTGRSAITSSSTPCIIPDVTTLAICPDAEDPPADAARIIGFNIKLYLLLNLFTGCCIKSPAAYDLKKHSEKFINVMAEQYDKEYDDKAA